MECEDYCTCPSLLSAYAGNRQFGGGLADLHGSHRPKDPFWSGRTIKRDHASIPKGGNGITQGLTRRNGKHERWFAYGFAAENNSRLGGAS